MPLVRRIHNRGATITVEAHGEVLFAATGDVGRWTNRFSQRARAFTAQEAPSNKRPRWSYYGKPLRNTFTASTTYQPGRMKVYSAIGSTAGHAAYVDQGTGIYGGGGPYQGKILPPWTRGSPSLYESTWVPPGSRRPIGTITIKGQRGQFFFDKGLARAFRSMRMRAYQVPGEGGPKMAAALNTAPASLGALGGSSGGSAFVGELQQWRAWRDAHFNSGRVLGKDGGSQTREGQRRLARAQASRNRWRGQRTQAAETRRRERSKERSQARRDAMKAKSTQKPAKPNKPAVDQKARRADRTAFLMAMQKKYGARNVDMASLQFKDGYWIVLVRVITERASGDLRPDWKEVRAKAKT